MQRFSLTQQLLSRIVLLCPVKTRAFLLFVCFDLFGVLFVWFGLVVVVLS